MSEMTIAEALLALAAPVPEPFRQVILSAADRARWQADHDRRVEAVGVLRRLLRLLAGLDANAILNAHALGGRTW